MVTALHYEIRVAGVLPPEGLQDFECLTAREPVETVIRGPLPDHAALRGLLARLETFGAQVVEVRRVGEVEPLSPLSRTAGPVSRRARRIVP